MPKSIEESEVAITLTKTEALVLFELLLRFSETDKLTIEHEAEKQVLWNVSCLLELSLVEPFSENYEELLQTARASLSPENPRGVSP